MKDKDPQPEPNFRTVTGQRRSAAMRERLLDAAVSVVAEKGLDALTTDDVIKAAGVARGTLYNHFKTLDELTAALAGRMADDVTGDVAQLDLDEPDPAVRLAHAVISFIERAAAEPQWGWLLVRLAEHSGPVGEATKKHLQSDLQAGRKQKRFNFTSREAAQDLVLGTTLASMRSVLEGRAGKLHAAAIAQLLLTGLGVAADEAAAVVRKATITREPG